LSSFFQGGKPLFGLSLGPKAGTRGRVRSRVLLLALTSPLLCTTALAQEQAMDVPVQTQAEAPPWADSEQAQYSDPGERPPPSARTNLWITAGAVTVGFYGMAYGTSYLWPSSPVAEDLRIPVIGPYSAVFGAGCGDRERGCGTFFAVLRTTLAAISAIGQTGGVLLLGEAVFMSTASSSAGDATRSDEAQGSASTALEPTSDPLFYAPMVDEDSLGFVIGGSF
jgi:hypothetical protein